MMSDLSDMAHTMSYHPQSWPSKARSSYEVPRQHTPHHESITCGDNIPYMRYGVHSNELLDKFFYYDPCAFTWIIRESGTHAEESTIGLLEREARSSGGLNYRGIFNSLITFRHGHWIPTIREREAHKSECLKVVRDQENDVARRLELSRETAHRTDGRRGEKSRNLAVRRGDGTSVVGDSAPGCAHYKAQHTVRNDDKHHWSTRDGSLDDERCVEVPGSNEQGWRGEEVTMRTQRDLELVDVEDMDVVFGKPRYEDELDAFTPSSSLKQLYLENKSKTVSTRRVVSPAPPPAVSMGCVPVSPRPTHSKMRNDHPHGPPLAVLSSHP
jgi:hypothetical protein